MTLSDFLPPSFRLAAIGIGAVLLLGIAGGIGLAVERHGEAKGRAELQPRLDAANARVGALTAANNQNLATIKEMSANQAANDLLAQQQAERVAALTQQADDAASIIRKLQNDDQDVAAFLATRIPDALRRVLPYAPAGREPAGGADKDGHAAAARAK